MDNEPKPEKVPHLTFYRLIKSARFPQRADRSAAGSLPTRAFRYCEAATTAAAFGYYVFPPLNFSLMWDGNDISWTWDGVDEWYPLRSVQYPGFRDEFDSLAPPDIREFSPPLLTALQEPGLVQLWTGIIARTAPDWSLLVRSPANMPHSGQYEPFEGIIESDQWFGPLITNLRLTKTDRPIDFRADYPLVQVQPIPRFVYEESLLNDYVLVPDLAAFRPDEWRLYHETVVRPHLAEHRPRGQYAATVRKRRKAELSQSE
jgi:hypothetical protein